jgi:NADH-quinone oxidoreductase subunit H
MDTFEIIAALVKVAVVVAVVLASVMFAIWAERRVVAFMQQRIGPNRVGPFGLLQGIADGVKLFFKEDLRPSSADPITFIVAPLLALVPAFMTLAVIPFGSSVTIFGREISLQLADLNVGVLYFLAMGSLMVYGVVLAGWASGSVYPLIGGVRSSAQMISYEIAMGMAIVSVVMYAGTTSTGGIVDAQAGTFAGVLPHWFALAQLPAFIIFMIAGFAETNRAPFDLPEAETELVAGFHTEYSGIRFAMFMLAEYVHVISTSAMAVTLFLGGWRGPTLPVLGNLSSVVWFLGKTGAVVFLFMWVRATMPRVRYDTLMRIGWKVLLPASVGWMMITATLVVLPQEFSRTTLAGVTGLIAALALVSWASWTTYRAHGTLSPIALMRKVIRGAA